MIDLLDKFGHWLGRWWNNNDIVFIRFFFMALAIVVTYGLMYKGTTVALKDYFDTKDHYEGCLNYQTEKMCQERYYGE